MSRRILLMIMALVVPELVIIWAARQYLSACDTADEFNGKLSEQLAQADGDHRKIGESPFTVTHGFFAWMGGFILYVNGHPRATLTPDELLRFVHDGSVDMRFVAEADIEDRSKSDALSKGIAIIQIVWFILQLAARYAQNLPITLLEIDTLAVAALMCFAYRLWLKKPQDVGRPYPIHWKGPVSPPNNLEYDEATDSEDFPDLIPSYLSHAIYFLFKIIGYPWVSPVVVHSRRVPSLRGFTYTHEGIMVFIGCFSAMVFGGIHCMGWNFLFQSHAEQLLWRNACLAVLWSSVSISISSGLSILQEKWGSPRFHFIFYFTMIIILIDGFAYIAARLILIVLMLLSVRSLPPGVYDTVAWTKFIPHL
ncbi:hypothetical protein M405DRAFT_938264 [Rhizopogon salebrosus TDB-379]|nr:hypothetical protein M405DRAFT_938264 [Rhizopogon salebrosus TDB-379]